MGARLSAGSFFDLFPFSHHTFCYYVLSVLSFGDFKCFDGSILLEENSQYFCIKV